MTAPAGHVSGEELVRGARRKLAISGRLGTAAGSLVVFAAVGFLIPVFLSDNQLDRLGLINGPLVVVFVVVIGVFVSRRLGRDFYRSAEWIQAERPPDEAEARSTLGLAAHAVKLDAIAWASGGLVFAVFNGVIQSWGFALVAGATIWLGGETTCAIDYLLYERALRPLTARALEAGNVVTAAAPGVRARLAVAWSLGTGVPLLGVLVVAAVGIAKPGAHTTYVAAAVLFLGVVATAAGLLAILFAAKAIADPLLAVRHGLEQIERGDLDIRVPVNDASEIGRLQSGFNQMADGLRERERIRDMFGRQVGADVAHAALDRGVHLGGEEREVGALFVDLVDSTGLAGAVAPSEVVRVLNRFFGVVVEVVEQAGGLVNKFEGDAALCVFGAPVPCEDPAGDALRAARSLAARLAQDLPEIDFGIGVSAGVAVAGNVGAEHRFEYTVIGDPINEAARLTELAKQRPERVLASGAALARAGVMEADAWSVTEAAVLRGRAAPTTLAHPQS